MSQCWAIVWKSGKFVLRYTGSLDEHPADHGHRAEVRDRAVWPIDREPLQHMGESVSFENGAILFDSLVAAKMLEPKIKHAVQVAILRDYPLWRQVNDLADPDSPEKQARAARRSALRERSNELEAMALNATDRSAIEAIWVEVLDLEKGS